MADGVKFERASDVEDAFGKLNSAVGDLRESGNLTREKVEKIAADLETVQRAHLESQTRGPEVGNADDREIEKRYLNADGSIRMTRQVGEIEFAGRRYEVEAPGLLDDAHAQNDWHDEFRTAVANRGWAKLVLRKNARTPYLDGEIIRLAARAPKAVRDALERSFNDSNSGEGPEWIDDGFMADLYRGFETPRGLAAAFRDVPVQSETFVRPKITVGATPYIRSKIADDSPASYTPSTPTTAQQSFTIPALAVRILADEMAVEDSSIAAIPQLQEELRRAIEDGYEDALVNGEQEANDAGHFDALATFNPRSRWGGTLGGTADHRLVMDGLRAKAFDASATVDQGAAQTAAGLLSLKSQLGERGVGQALLVVSPEVMVQKIMGFTEVVTLDKFGPQASILSGSLASIYGDPIIMSRFVEATYNASGVYDNITTTKSLVLYVDTAAFAHYTRRGAMLEIDKEIKSGHFELVATLRRLWASADAASVKNVAMGYNWL